MTLVEEKTLVTESVRLHRDAVEVAYEVGEYLRGVFRKPFEVEEKVDHTDLVTEHDRASERMIVAALRERDPSYGFLGEEFGAQPGEGPVTWHLDPIDCTSNFVQGHAFFCVMPGWRGAWWRGQSTIRWQTTCSAPTSNAPT